MENGPGTPLIYNRLVKVYNLSSLRLMGNYWCSGFTSYSIQHYILLVCFNLLLKSLFFVCWLSHYPISFHLILSSVAHLNFSCFSLLCLSPILQLPGPGHAKPLNTNVTENNANIFCFFSPSFEWLHFSIRLNRHETLSCLGYEEMKSFDVGVKIK